MVPAIIFLVAAFILTPTMDLLNSMKGLGDQVQEAGPLIGKLLMALVGLGAGGILSLIGMFIGVIKLTAFTRAYLICPLPTSEAAIKSESYKAEAQSLQSQAIQALAKQKGYLAKVWLLAGLIMLPLFFVFFASSFWATLLTLPDTSAMPIPAEARKMAIWAQLIVAASMIIMSNYSIVTVAVSSMTNRPIGAAIRQTLLLGLTTAPLMTAVSAFVLLLSTVISTPYVVVTLLHPVGQWSTPGTLPVALAWEVWQVASGIMLYPVCTALLIEVVRDCIEVQETVAMTEPAVVTDPAAPAETEAAAISEPAVTALAPVTAEAPVRNESAMTAEPAAPRAPSEGPSQTEATDKIPATPAPDSTNPSDHAN